MRSGLGKAGLVIPLAVGGNVGRNGVRRRSGSACPSGSGGNLDESVEVLVRHTASRLENVTSSRTVEVLTKPA